LGSAGATGRAQIVHRGADR